MDNDSAKVAKLADEARIDGEEWRAEADILDDIHHARLAPQTAAAANRRGLRRPPAERRWPNLTSAPTTSLERPQNVPHKSL